MTVFLGDDWAEDHHDVHLMDEDCKKLAARRLPDGLDGVRACHELVASHINDPGEVIVGIETDRGLWVTALVAVGYQVYAINPLAASRYIGIGTTSAAPSPTRATRRCSPIWSAQTATTTAKSPVTARTQKRYGSSPALRHHPCSVAIAAGQGTFSNVLQ